MRIDMCESAIRKQDDYVFKKGPRFVDYVVAAAESRVRKYHKLGALDFWCEEGCPRRRLLYLLGMCENRGVTSAGGVTGFNSRELPKELRRIKECASTIGSINDSTFGDFEQYDERSTMHRFLALPSMLTEYSALVQHAVKYIGGKSDFYLHLAKALLVQFVREHTGDFHDEKLADLVSGMIRDHDPKGNHPFRKQE